MQDKTFELVTQDHYFRSEGTQHRYVPVGATVADLVKLSGIPEQFHADLTVVISKGVEAAPVPSSHWSRVRPGENAHVHIYPSVNGPVVGLILSAVLPSVASTLAGTLFAAGTLGFKIAVAAFTIIGTLAINALIPPPSVPEAPKQDDPNFTITGSSNAENRYGIYPAVFGRHQMFPPKTARGYTEGEGDNIHFRGRFTFGYGPVALETLKIGTTPITDFEDVEIEFLNVDQAQTLAHMPDLAPMVTAWRQGATALSLYPDDIAEDSYSVKLAKDVDVVRATRERAVSVSVDVTYQGLVKFDGNNNKQDRSVEVKYRYRKVGDQNWTDAGTETHTGRSTAQLRFTKTIQLPEEGEYDIEVTRLTEDSDDSTVRDDAYLSAIRSVQAGALPSHADIAEIAVRIKASDQLNGQIETLNAIVHQMAPVWDGTAWSAPQPVRHPAWIYARALMGPMISNPVADGRVQLEDLRTWAAQEPHWTCDMVIDQPSQVGEVLDLICATGRARRTLRDLKYSVIRDGGAGPVIQQFTPRNSWDFQGEITFPKEIHGFRVRCISERLDWQQDEIVAYADGYDASNATEFETLDLRGVILSKDDADGGNAWRLGRYHLAQAILRPESFEWKCDIDHLRVNMGDKVRLVHDVPLIGVGSGRVRELFVEAGGNLTAFAMDEAFALDANSYRVCLRGMSGEEAVFMAAPPSEADPYWRPSEVVDGTGFAVGDLVSIEKITSESMEILVSAIVHQGDLTATIRGVPAAPAVLDADQGEIPAYVPNISRVHTREDGPPAQPILLSSDVVAQTNPVRMVVDGQVYRDDRFSIASYLAVLVDPETGEEEDRQAVTGTAFTLPLPEVQSYDLKVYAIDQQGRISPPVIESVTRSAEDELPANVDDFQIRVIGDQAQLTWSDAGDIVLRYHIKHLPPDAPGGWNGAVDVVRDVTGRTATVPALPGRYLIKAVSIFDRYSADPTVVTSTILSLANYDVVREVALHPAFEGDLENGLYRDGGELFLGSSGLVAEWGLVAEIGLVSEYGPSVAQAIYESATITDLGASMTSRVSATVDAFGLDRGALVAEMGLMVDVGLVAGNVDGTWRVWLQVSTTENDPASGDAEWSAWSDLLAGDYLARGFRFRVIFQSFGDQVSAVLRGVSVQIDVPDRDVAGSDVPCPPEGVYVPFSPPFLEKPAILIRGQSLPLVHERVVTNETREGFHIRYLDGDGNGIDCSFDFEAKGYGHLT
jgi:hypothetical protein